MEENEEEEDVHSRRRKHQLFIALKTTVEGLLATNSSNVWNTYGGLPRLCKSVEAILNHRLKFVAGDYGSVVDFWPFVKGLKWLCPVMTSFIEKIRKGHYPKGTSKGQIWVQECLKEHNLVMQLKVLVDNEQHLHRHYFEDAFLFSNRYFKAMCICLQAVEENRVSMLAEIDAKLLSFQPSSRTATPSRIKSVSLPVQSSTNARTSSRRRSHRASYSDYMDLAPPFTSPPSQESFLCQSDEHATPCSPSFSTSPEESKPRARDALRKVLRKSGSDSPPDVSTLDTDDNPYSLYSSLNSDPLLHIDFFKGSRSPGSRSPVSRSPGSRSQGSKSPGSRSPVKGQMEEKVQEEKNQRPGSGKKVLERSASEGILSKNVLDKCTTELAGETIVEDDGVNKHVTKSLTSLPVARKPDKLQRSSRVIFSDSESVDVDSSASSTKSKSSKHSHKRTRSDISGIKLDKRKEEMPSESTVKHSDSTTRVVSGAGFDMVDSGNASFFPRPLQGQSLIHYLSTQDFNTCANLDKENAHFSISEALIAAIEQMKWNHIIAPTESSRDGPEEEEESDEEIKELQQRIRIRKREKLKQRAQGFPAMLSDGRTDTTNSRSQSASPFSSRGNSDYSDSESLSGVEDQQIELDAEQKQGDLAALKNSGLSLSMASLYSDADLQKGLKFERETSVMESCSSFYSAESVAISLLKKFSEKQLPKASDLQWLVTEQEAPQRLLPLPDSFPISPDDAENTDSGMNRKKSRTRLRGNLEWAPPRPQIIFNVHPKPRRNTLLAKQNYRCAGCGMKVEAGYAKRYRYCEYLGKYLCQCCHGNQALSVIPGKILKHWDFTKYHVSNFAQDFINKIWTEPLFNLLDINLLLYKRVRLLEQIRDLRMQLKHLQTLLKLCRHCSSLSEDVSNLPNHWLTDPHLYSLSDLVAVKTGMSGTIYSQLKSLTTQSISHVEACQFCQCFGFICEMCRVQNDVIFPYQLHKVSICQGCKSCFHKTCFVPEKCPKCARIEARRQRLQQDSGGEEEEVEEDEVEEEEHGIGKTTTEKTEGTNTVDNDN